MSVATKVILTPGMSVVEVATHIATGAVDAETAREWEKDENKRKESEAEAKAEAKAANKLTFKINALGKHLVDKAGKPRFLKVTDKATGVESEVPIIGKGNGQLNGLQRMPVTLYEGQWRRLAVFIGTVIKALDDAPEGALAKKC